jgi:hypothetical protein
MFYLFDFVFGSLTNIALTYLEVETECVLFASY